jgi:hypothetical protein
MKNIILLITCILAFASCGTKKTNPNTIENSTAQAVNIEYFKSADAGTKITKIPCTLSDGTKTDCYKIETDGQASDHTMGPWCPDNINDDKTKGGIWLANGEVHDVDGVFVKNLASFYKDDTWKMYDENGKIFVTNTKEDCINAANPNVGKEYENFCVECLPSYINEISRSFIIPVKPVSLEEPVSFMGKGGNGPEGGNRPPRGEKPPRGDRPERGPRGDEGGVPSTQGIALNGVEFSAPAPVNNILGAYTLAPFDDAGGHINVHQGYHYHTTIGISYSIKQEDGHAPLIGYAMDGYAIYGRYDESGNEVTDLDECGGQFDEIRGYHYHADNPGANNFINCLRGAYAKEE